MMDNMSPDDVMTTQFWQSLIVDDYNSLVCCLHVRPGKMFFFFFHRAKKFPDPYILFSDRM
jgi:hypothetical protein